MTENSNNPNNDASNGNDGFVWSHEVNISSGTKVSEKPTVIVKPPKPEEPKSPPSK